MSVRVGLKQRALIFSVKLSNANPVSTWISERLTLPSTADIPCFLCVCFFFFFFFFFVVVVVLLLIFFVVVFFLFFFFLFCVFFCFFFFCFLVFVFSLLLLFCGFYFVLVFLSCLLTFCSHLVTHSNNSICMCSADAFS